jgi:hypothetical protein
MSVRGIEPSAVVVVSLWRKRTWLIASVIATFFLVGFAVSSGWSLAKDRSMDVVSTGELRLGFYGAGWFSHWTCDDGHDHWSAPYWLGLVLLVPPTGLLWYGWNRRAVRAAGGQKR